MEAKKKTFRVFVAEDEPLTLMGFEAMLRLCGHEIAGTAMNGADAVSGVRECQPDIVILDIDMPVLNGIEAAAQINAKRPVPVVIVTGYRKSDYVERSCEAGVAAYLQKPVDEYELRAALQIAASQFEKQRSAEDAQQAAEEKLKRRILIERAKGILMDQFGLPEAQAMKALQKKSKDTNTRMEEVARQIIERSEQLL